MAKNSPSAGASREAALVGAFYRSYVRNLVKEVMADEGVDYQTVAARLRKKFGGTITAQVLTNRVNRGSFSLGFAFQLFEALDVESISIPEPPRKIKPSKQ